MNSNEESAEFHVRPRYRRESPAAPDEIENRLRKALDQDHCPCKGTLIRGHATIFIPPEEQHYWSPQLSLSFEKTEKGSLIRGLFSPRPQVWTMFVLFYATIAFAGLLVMVFGFSYWTLGKSTAVLWWVPVLGLLYLTLYLVAYSGQKLGREQMIRIHRFVENVIKQADHSSP